MLIMSNAHDIMLPIRVKQRLMPGVGGAARAVVEAGREDEIVIVGMDHDQEALRYLRDGIIYALGVQDCYSIGFDTIQVAVKIADGHLPGEDYPEKTEEITTIIYQNEAAKMLQELYGEIE